MGRRSWTSAEDDLLRTLYESGQDDEEISLQLSGRTTSAVASRRNVLTIHRPRETLKRAPEWTAEELLLGQRMYEEGCSREEIAIAVGRTVIAIKRIITGRKWKRLPLDVDLSQFDSEFECWRHVSPVYAISSRGRVMSLHPGRIGSMLAHWIDKWGYHHVALKVASGGKSKRHAIHRLMAIAFIGDPPTLQHQVAHNDGDSGNNVISNLRWATPQENQQDRVIHGTAPKPMPKHGGQFLKKSEWPTWWQYGDPIDARTNTRRDINGQS